MKITILIVLMLFLCGIAIGQQLGRQPQVLRPGTVSGEILIKEVSGNHIGNFSCSNLTATVSKLGGGWQRKATATGSFAGRRCSFRITNVPAAEQFVAVLTADFPNGCDQKNFETTTSFPMEIKSREQLKYNFIVSKIRCVLVK